MKRHCDLCDHQKLSLKEGNLCGLTNKKPHFLNTCINIKLNKKLQENTADILIDYEDLNNSKRRVYINSYIKILFGSFIVLCGFLLWRFFLNNNGINLISLKYLVIILGVIFTTGFSFIKTAIIKIKSHRMNVYNVKENKYLLEEILNLYNKKYTYNARFHKEKHGIDEIEIDLKIT